MLPLLVMSETQDPGSSAYAYPEQNRRGRDPFPSPLFPIYRQWHMSQCGLGATARRNLEAAFEELGVGVHCRNF